MLLFRTPSFSRVLVLFIILLFLIAFMPQEYSCVPACKESYTKSSSLTKHKRTCSHYANSRRRSQQIQLTSGESTLSPAITRPAKYAVRFFPRAYDLTQPI